MFKDEIKEKFAPIGELFAFSVCMLSRDKLVVSGVKRVLFADDVRILLKLHGEELVVEGERLKIAEIGGGDIFVTGHIGGLHFE